MHNFLSKVLLLTFFILFIDISSSLAQDYRNDIDLIEKNNTQLNTNSNHSKPNYPWYNKINPLFWLYKGTIGFYQKNISVQIAANCVFETTCSHYSKVLVDEFGVLGGTLLSIERLSRCNRISLVETSLLNFSEEGKIKENIEQYYIK